MPRKLTKEEFISRARAIHGDKYNYSKVEYIDAKTKVKIICPEHGIFLQTPDSHLRGKGCQNCSPTLKRTTKSFIEKAKEIHGDRYDYSKVNYVNSETKVEIICPIHGSFFQAPSSHLHGQGCQRCGGKSILSEADFKEKAAKIHNNKYDYSRVNYKNMYKKVEILCPVHGSFLQTPQNHLRTTGCPLCGKAQASSNRSDTTESFIQKAREIHGDKYDYSKVNYVNSETKVEIICKEHGSFFQTPSSHLQGRGCPVCGREIILNAIKLSQEGFIKKASEVHNNKYDYSNVDYKSIKEVVEIVCPVHGTFFQAPDHHLRGSGCPECGRMLNISKRSLTTDVFIAKAKEVHGNKYIYNKVNYINNHTKVKIMCPKHGYFSQVPSAHLQGQGCPHCGREIALKTGGTSKEETTLFELLTKHFKFSGIKRNYNKDKRYPFFCDFYIPERDLFIEYNAFWTHGSHWFNKKSSKDTNRIFDLQKKLKENININSQYKSAIHIWSQHDVLKRQTAHKNKLNYVVLWDKKDIDKWFELGCPDGHDYDFEYSWIEDDKERSEWLKNKVKR